MILLDTNALSALMRSEPDPEVVDWLDSQAAESLWTTTVTVFEICAGIERLPVSRRRRSLQDAFAQVLEHDLDGRVVNFDESAARAAGKLLAGQAGVGRSIEIRDVQIAGIALARRATVATRNIRHFQHLGVDLVDPWNPGAGERRSP